MATMATLLTVEDYMVLPEDGRHYQLIHGELFMSPSPTRFHQHISLNLSFLISSWIRGKGAGAVYAAPFDVHLDEHNVFQPDLVYVSPGRLSILTDAGINGAPDLVVEILSPSTRKLDLGPKKKVFAAHGVREFWAIDPNERTVDVFDLKADVEVPAQTFGDSDSIKRDVLAGLEIDLAEVFDY